MRWLTFILLAVTALTLQTALAPSLVIFGARPDWLLIIVIFYAFHAPRRESAIAAFVLGLCADLMTIERLGLIASSYLMAALLVSSVRGYLFRLEALTQFLVTLVVCVIVRGAWLICGRVVYDPIEGFFSMLGRDVLATSVYTALWAPVLHPLLFRLSRVLGLPRQRYTFMGKRSF